MVDVPLLTWPATTAAKETDFMNANKIRYAIYEGNIQSVLLWPMGVCII